MENKNLVFILSTGRTGTMFFQDYINETCDDFRCLHEPVPSRRFIFLSNMFQARKISSDLFTKIYLKSRKKLFNETKESNFVESSNFMSGGVFALNKNMPNIKIIHLVRHPQDYVKSHYDYGYWKGYKKIVRKFVPFSVERLPLTASERQDPFLVLYSRWKEINNMIAKYKDTNEYLMLRFEDVFKSDPIDALSQLNTLRKFIGANKIGLEDNLKWLSKPKNVSVKKPTNSILEEYKWYAESHLKECMDKYDYVLK